MYRIRTLDGSDRGYVRRLYHVNYLLQKAEQQKTVFSRYAVVANKRKNEHRDNTSQSHQMLEPSAGAQKIRDSISGKLLFLVAFSCFVFFTYFS